MKKALVFYLYGTRNAGDMAICVGAIELLRQENYQIVMVSRFSAHEDEFQKSQAFINDYYPDVRIIPGPFSFERDFSRFQKLKAYTLSYMKVLGILKDTQIDRLIEESDVVFFNGGNLLRGERIADYLRLIALFYPIQKAKKAQKPVYCLPQSTAGTDVIGKRLLQKYLKGMRQIYVREAISYQALVTAYPNISFRLSTDLAFYCQDTKLAEERSCTLFDKTASRPRIALILRHTGIGDIGHIDSQTEARLLEVLRGFVISHSDYDYWIILQTLKDKDISQKFMSLVKDHAHIKMAESHDPLVLRELYKQMACTITMRLHAGILSLSALTPVVGLFSEVWGLKNQGIMSAYGMPYLQVEDGQTDLNSLFNEAIAHSSQEIEAHILSMRTLINIEG